MKTCQIQVPAWNRQDLALTISGFARHAKRLLAAYPTLIPGAAVCYTAIFGLLVYNLAAHARLDSWRQFAPLAEATLTASVLPSASAPSCAEFAGMGQRLCGAEAKFEATRARFQQRVEARKERVRLSVGVKPAERAKSAPLPPAPSALTPAYLPDQTEPAKPTLAARE